MAVARSTRETFSYVTVADRALPKEKQTIFHLRRLATNQQLMLGNLLEVMGTMAVVTLRIGLAGWENFVDENGNAVPFKRDTGTVLEHGVPIENPASKESIGRLSITDAQEIAAAIHSGNVLSEDDVKN